jgi:hypothetical protein
MKRTTINPPDGITRNGLSESVRVLGEQRSVQNELPKFTVGTWHGQTQWQCSFCAWDTLVGEAAMMDHIRDRHLPPEPLKPALPIYDASGKLKG